MNLILQDSWDVLKKNPNLYFVPALLLLIGGFIDPTTSVFATVTFFLFNIAFMAGWINQIKTVIASEDKRANFDDLLIGIGRYFGAILSGTFVFVFVLLSGFILYLTLANAIIGTDADDLTRFQETAKELATLKTSEVQDYLAKMDQGLLGMVYKWAIAIGIYGIIVGLAEFFLGLWPQYAVLKSITWPEAFKNSFRIVTKHFGLYSLLIFIHLMFTAVIYTSFFLFTENIFLQLFLTIADIVTKAYFTVLFCLFIVKFDSSILMDLKNKDEIQPAVSKIQKPDNKK